MSGLNLRWWRKRPSTHVADYPEVFDISPLLGEALYFDLYTNLFQTAGSGLPPVYHWVDEDEA